MIKSKSTIDDIFIKNHIYKRSLSEFKLSTKDKQEIDFCLGTIKGKKEENKIFTESLLRNNLSVESLNLGQSKANTIISTAVVILLCALFLNAVSYYWFKAK